MHLSIYTLSVSVLVVESLFYVAVRWSYCLVCFLFLDCVLWILTLWLADDDYGLP